ncbi:MAG: hypothetical protein WDN69_37315 [Aliidongia sp.]
MRASYFLPQLTDHGPARVPIGPALILILGGLFKKVVVANYLATDLVDPIFAAPDRAGRPGPALRRLRLCHTDLLRFQRL